MTLGKSFRLSAVKRGHYPLQNQEERCKDQRWLASRWHSGSVYPFLLNHSQVARYLPAPIGPHLLDEGAQLVAGSHTGTHTCFFPTWIPFSYPSIPPFPCLLFPMLRPKLRASTRP